MSLHPPSTAKAGHADLKFSSIANLNYEFPVLPGEEISVFIETITSQVRDKSALLQFEFFDANQAIVRMEDWHPRSKAFGDFQYLQNVTANEYTQEQFDLLAPPSAVTLKITGHQWNPKVETRVAGDIQIQSPSLNQMVTRFPSGKVVPRSSAQFNQTVQVPSGVSIVDIDLTYQSDPGVKSLTPIQVIFLDKQHNYIPGVSALPKNVNFGSFLPLEKSPEAPTLHKTSLQLPRGTAYLQFVGIDWKLQNATIYGGITVTASVGKEFSIEKWLESVPSEAQLIVIDTTAPPLGHETLSLRPNNLSAAYSRLGAYVIFLPFSTLQEFQPQISEKLVQVPRDDFSFLLELLLNKREARNSIFISSSFPSINSVTAAKRLKATGWTIIYEARDDMEEFNRVGYSKWYEPQLERQMLRIADQVVSVSSALDEKLVSLWPKLKHHAVIPNGVNTHVIQSSQGLRSIEATETRNQSQTVGYVGHLTPSWFDWELILSAARKFSNVQFEIVGHGKPEKLDLPSNVKYLGPKSHAELPPIVSNWKCGLIPFKDLPLTRSVDPNKIYEYFAWGLRCLTAPMGLVHEYPSTWVYQNEHEFNEALEEILGSEITGSEIQVLENFLQSASWDNRAEEMLKLFEPFKPLVKE